ncbi:MAG: DUF3617 family protein [Alphaproteobacteria bacterium]
MRPALILAAAFIATPALAQDMPTRKAGLWDMTMTFEGRNTPPQTMQHCIDATTDKAMQDMSAGARGQSCSKREMKKVGDTIVFDSVCSVGAGTATSHGVISGDFNSAYTIKINSKREGGPPVPNMPAETSMSIAAKWLGACKADQKPGDIIMANGMKMNVNDLPKGGAPGAPGGRPGMPPGGPPGGVKK